MIELLNVLNIKGILKRNEDRILTCAVFSREALILLVVLLPDSSEEQTFKFFLNFTSRIEQ